MGAGADGGKPGCDKRQLCLQTRKNWRDLKDEEKKIQRSIATPKVFPQPVEIQSQQFAFAKINNKVEHSAYMSFF